MSYKDKHARFSFKDAEEFEQDAKQLGMTESEYIISAVKHFIECKNAERVQSMKLIVFRYPGKCLKCGRTIEEGEYGLWGRGTGAICLDCHATRFGDKAIVKKFLKLKEFNWLIKSLEAQCNEKAEQLRIFNFYEIINNMYGLSNKISELITRYLKEGGFQKPEQEKQTLDEVEALMEKLRYAIADANQFMKVPLQKKKREEEAYTS